MLWFVIPAAHQVRNVILLVSLLFSLATYRCLFFVFKVLAQLRRHWRSLLWSSHFWLAPDWQQETWPPEWPTSTRWDFRSGNRDSDLCRWKESAAMRFCLWFFLSADWQPTEGSLAFSLIFSRPNQVFLLVSCGSPLHSLFEPTTFCWCALVLNFLQRLSAGRLSHFGC